MILCRWQCYDAGVIETGNHLYGNRDSEPFYCSFSGFLRFLHWAVGHRDHIVFYVGLSYLPE